MDDADFHVVRKPYRPVEYVIFDIFDTVIVPGTNTIPHSIINPFIQPLNFIYLYFTPS